MKKLAFLACLLPILWAACSSTATTRKESGEWAKVPEILKNIVPPTFPDSIYDVTAYGAKSDTSFDSRPAILEAINQCNTNGGGTVLIPAGNYFSKGAILLKSNVNLHVADGARLEFSTVASDYLPMVLTKWEGTECFNYSPFIYAYQCTNVALTGKGTIDGNATEECFISPKRGEAEGIVYASKPLSYQGQLIENFSVRFEKGKAVEVKAEKGEELLKTMIAMDDGASYLGECALVPQHSPIAESGILFYNTLFDENAACHLALGMGFADTIKDFQNKTLDECRALGINDSMIHEDFMIGCDSMNIDGICEDGRVVPIFRSGNWAF